MTTPLTRIDTRFGQPDAQASEWDATQRILDEADMFWITTVRADGRPHVTPLVAVWLGGKLHFTTGPAEQKAVNLRANPNVVLTTGDSRWDDGVDVVVEGVASRVTEPAALQRLVQAWAKKWDGRWQWAVGDGCFHDGDDTDEHPAEILVFAVTPTKVLAFGKGVFSQTTHRF